MFSMVPCVPSCDNEYDRRLQFIFWKSIGKDHKVNPVLEQLMGTEMLFTGGGLGRSVTSTKVGMNGSVCARNPTKRRQNKALKRWPVWVRKDTAPGTWLLAALVPGCARPRAVFRNRQQEPRTSCWPGWGGTKGEVKFTV